MKVVTAEEMVRVEKLAYSRGASEAHLMERAGESLAVCLQSFLARHHLKPKIGLLCGRGNNGGDAYVAGRILQRGGFSVHAWALAPYGESSPLCQLTSRLFTEAGGELTYIQSAEALPFASVSLLVDALFGTGFRGKVDGIYEAVIEAANRSALPIVAVDIPSGIHSSTGNIEGVAIHAQETCCLGFPKLGCFLEKAWNHVGRLHVCDIGLDAFCEAEAQATCLLIDQAELADLLPPLVRNRNKYETGYVVGWGGSPGMPGAPLLASFATLRAGAGIVRLLHPAGMEPELAAAPYEVIRQGYLPNDLSALVEAMQRARALFIGPGLGRAPETAELLRALLPRLEQPVVLDADAITLTAYHALPLPKRAILTPHHGEMKRLLGITETLSLTDLIEKSRRYAETNEVTVILKGAPTYVFHPGTLPYLCVRGNPGMATAGSGDVLTGIVAALLAQSGDPLRAALLAVQLHALAGEKAATEKTAYGMVASDLIAALPQAFADTMQQIDAAPLRG